MSYSLIMRLIVQQVQARQSMQAELYGYTAGSLTTILFALLTMAVDAGGAMYDPAMTLCMV